MINLEPTIADSALGKFQLAADKDNIIRITII